MLFLLLLQAVYDSFLSESVTEVRAEYAKAVQKAMLDYVIASPLERQRLSLEGLEPLLMPRNFGRGPLGPPIGAASHQEAIDRKLPAEWHEHVALAR